MVHRLIRQTLRNRLNKSQLKKQTEFLLRAVEHCSETEQNAVETERDTTDLKMTEYYTHLEQEHLKHSYQKYEEKYVLFNDKKDFLTEKN